MDGLDERLEESKEILDAHFVLLSDNFGDFYFFSLLGLFCKFVVLWGATRGKMRARKNTSERRSEYINKSDILFEIFPATF